MQRIDFLLDLALDQWGRLPEVETEIDTWDQLDQIVFIEEWPIEEDRLLFLEQYAAEGAMTPEQIARYDDLKRIVARNRPIIRALQQS